jgi:hypothetical protein
MEIYRSQFIWSSLSKFEFNHNELYCEVSLVGRVLRILKVLSHEKYFTEV